MLTAMELNLSLSVLCTIGGNDCSRPQVLQIGISYATLQPFCSSAGESEGRGEQIDRGPQRKDRRP